MQCRPRVLLFVLSNMRCRRSTNSFRTKLFGQAKRVPGEEIIDAVPTASNRVRVHPLSNFRRYWDLTAIVLTIHTVLVLPFRAAFFWDYYRELEARHTILEQLQVRLKAHLIRASLEKYVKLHAIKMWTRCCRIVAHSCQACCYAG